MEEKTKLHIVFDGDVTLDGVLGDIRSEKVLKFPDKPTAWVHLYAGRGEMYERLIPAGTDTEKIPDIYVLKK